MRVYHQKLSASEAVKICYGKWVVKDSRKESAGTEEEDDDDTDVEPEDDARNS